MHTCFHIHNCTPQVMASVLQLQALAARDQAEGKRAASLDVVAAVASNSTGAGL